MGPLRRVAFIVHAYPKISETFVMYSALGLTRAGWSVDILPVDPGAGGSDERHPVQDELDRSVRIIRPQAAPEGGASGRATLRQLMRRHGFAALRTIDPTRFARDAFTLRPVFLAEALDRGGPYDIVHCHFGTLAAPVLELRRAGLLDARVVVHFRGNDISRFIEMVGEHAYDAAFAEADWFVSNCRHFRDRAIALGCDPGRIDVVPSGCDLSRFPLIEPRASGAGPIRLLAVGRLVEKKGHGLAIDALAALRGRGRDVRLRIVGDGPLRATLEAAAAAAGLGDRVEFVGALPHQAILDELACADVFLAPSVRALDGDEDGPVNTLKEAMATGTPVVATRHGGIPELVEHGINGFLCAEDAVDLADKTDEMIAARPHWPVFGRAGRRTVEAKFSLDVATKKLLGAYAQALSAPLPAL